MKQKNILSIFGLLATLGIAAYLDSPYSLLNKNYAYTADQPVMAQPQDIKTPKDLPEVMEKLEKRVKVDGYILETYEEYEVYKDKNGKIIKSEPTGKTDTLKYWDYKSNKKDR